jgi:Tol biopolymer transport system component/DNA-binding SARP family transcriptional activator
MLSLRLLGEIRLTGSSGLEIDTLVRQPKRLALLAYLSTPEPGTWHRRDMLLALFWPDFDTAHARTSLRNALYVIRQAVGENVLRTRGDEEISVDPAHLETDLGTTWVALRESRTADALSLYGGDLMPGLFPPDSEGFMRWLDTERMRIRVAVCASGVALLDEMEKAGRLAEAVVIGRRVIEIQPDDETIVRRVIALHEANGDKAGALGLFENYRARLAAEFDAEPAAETVAMAERLRATTSERTARRSREPNPRATVQRDSPVESFDLVEPVTSEHPRWRAPTRTKRLAALAGATLVVVFGILAWSMSRPARAMSIGASSTLTADEGLQVQAAISPNGRLVAYAKGNSNRLRIFVQRIGGGQAWPLTSDSTALELMPRWSPDNDQLLFLSRYSAYVAPSIGGTARVVARGTDIAGMVRSASWSPTGDSIAIVRRDSLMVQPLIGTGTRYVGSGSQLHSCAWSPDGRWIACVSGNLVALQAGPLFGNEAPSAIVLFAAGGGGAVDVTGAEFQHRSPAWSHDGRYLWMLSNRDGASGEAYAIRVSGGKPGRDFVRVGLTAESIGLSSGRIVYSVPVRRANIWSVAVPGDSMLTVGDSKRITSGTALIELVTASTGSPWLVYDSNISGNADIYRISSEGGEPERLTSDTRPEYAGALSPDGTELAWQRFVNGRRRIFVRRLDSDADVEITAVAGDQGVPRWSPDGRALAAWSHDTEEGAIFVVRRDERGRWQGPAWRLEGGQLPVWSHDARTLAFVRYDGRIQLIPADSGEVRTVYTPRPASDDPVASNVVWSLDPTTIWFIGSSPQGHGGIWSVSADGGRPRLRVQLDESSGRLHGPMFGTDGSRFFFTLDERFSNVRWAELVER